MSIFARFLWMAPSTIHQAAMLRRRATKGGKGRDATIGARYVQDGHQQETR